MSLAFKLVISSHDIHKNDVSERNVCYLSICKEGPLALHRHPSHCKFFSRVVFLVVLLVLYHPILSNYLNKYLKCAACFYVKPPAEFSKNQKRRGGANLV